MPPSQPHPSREAWQATVYRAAKSWTLPKRPCARRRLTFFACGSSALVRIEREGGAATWLAEILAAPSVQGHGVPSPQELWPHQSLLLSLLKLAIRRPIWPVVLRSPAFQALRGLPCLGSFSVVLHIRHIEGSPGLGPTLYFSGQAFDGPASLLFSC